MAVQNKEIQDKLTEVLSAANVVLPVAPEIQLPGLTKPKAKKS